jgi:hypothetical protein
MSEDDNQDNINSSSEHEAQPERSAIDPSERGESGSVPEPWGVGLCNTPPKNDKIKYNPLKRQGLENGEGRILRAGIDSLTLSIYCDWEVDPENQDNCLRLHQFKELKLKALKGKETTMGTDRSFIWRRALDIQYANIQDK